MDDKPAEVQEVEDRLRDLGSEYVTLCVNVMFMYNHMDERVAVANLREDTLGFDVMMSDGEALYVLPIMSIYPLDNPTPVEGPVNGGS